MHPDDDPLGPYNDFWAMPVKQPKWPLYLTAFIVWTLLSLCNPGVWLVIYALV